MSVPLVAKRLRANTNYPWSDCIEAARRSGYDYSMAIELLPVIYRERQSQQIGNLT